MLTNAIELDFAMFDQPRQERRQDIIAVERGHRLVAATVTWYAYGEVYVSLECLGGLTAVAARAYLCQAVQEAHKSRPEVGGMPAHGPQFTAGRKLARDISHAMLEGSARWRMEEVA